MNDSGSSSNHDNTSDDDAEYWAIYEIFKRFLRDYENVDDRWDLLEEMMALRAEFAFNHAVRGFGMDFEKALDLLRNHNSGLTALEDEKRKILVAALDNLVDFAVAEEFRVFEELPDSWDYTNHDDVAECEEIFKRYNKVYAGIENGDIEYAMGIAAGWITYSETSWLTYMTQGDNRVRPWHMALEGTSYPKQNFPSWLIPPIEHGCRCFLVEEDRVGGKLDLSKVVAQTDVIPDFVSPVFRESVARGERIFSDAHSYFQIPKEYKPRLREIAQRIKEKWLGKE